MRARWGRAVLFVAAAGAVLMGGAADAGGQAPATTTPPEAMPTSTSDMQVISEVPYYSGGPTFDAYLPKDGRAAHPALIMVHGGGWEGTDLLQLAPFAAQAATEEHWAAFTVNYRLDANDHAAWPDELHDVQAAVGFLVANAPTYAIDPTNVLVMGDSAGANLAALISEVGTANPINGSPVGGASPTSVPMRAVALWSPPVDLADLVGHAGAAPGECGSDTSCDFAWTPPDVVDYLGCPPTACPQTYADASPITWVSPTTLPSYVANSSDELVPLGQVQAYVAALKRAGVDVSFDELHGTEHATQYGDQVWAATVDFLRSHLTADAAASTPPTDGDQSRSGLTIGALVLAVAAVVVVAVVMILRRRRVRA